MNQWLKVVKGYFPEFIFLIFTLHYSLLTSKELSWLKSNRPPKIIGIKGFKYTPNKHIDYEKNTGSTPFYKQAMEILNGKK